MTIFELILLIIAIVFTAPTLVFLCVKWGIVGFYRGKESFKRQNEFNRVQNNNEEEN